MSDPGEDKLLEDYLHRKSALSMGYRRVYVETPPPELDRSIEARARRALRWLLPGLLAAVIAIGFAYSINIGVNRYMGAMLGAEKNIQRTNKEIAEQAEKERLSAPISVIIDPAALAKDSSAQPTREQWLAKIDALKRAGKKAEADAELKKLRAAYPDKKAN